MEDLPFVLSLSKHEHDFFSSLLSPERHKYAAGFFVGVALGGVSANLRTFHSALGFRFPLPLTQEREKKGKGLT